MNLNQMGLRYNIKGDLVNMKPKEQEAVMLNRKALFKPLRRARWLAQQQKKVAG